MSADREWIKPTKAAKKIGVSKPTMYRLLPRLANEGVEIFKPAQRVTLINLADFERWAERQRWSGVAENAASKGGEAK
jgi:transposase